MSGNSGNCLCCKREVPLTFHHLIPKKVHRRARFKKKLDRSALQQGIAVCRLCHRGIHRQYDEMTLAMQFNTAESLLQDTALAKHFEWAAKQREC